jgi:hypothetical protein
LLTATERRVQGGWWNDDSSRHGQAAEQMQPESRPGATVLEQRYQPVSASERSADVTAFVEAYQPMQQAQVLLPIDPNGEPTLPDTPASGGKC